jgi:hypothetical protein
MPRNNDDDAKRAIGGPMACGALVFMIEMLVSISIDPEGDIAQNNAGWYVLSGFSAMILCCFLCCYIDARSRISEERRPERSEAEAKNSDNVEEVKVGDSLPMGQPTLMNKENLAVHPGTDTALSMVPDAFPANPVSISVMPEASVKVVDQLPLATLVVPGVGGEPIDDKQQSVEMTPIGAPESTALPQVPPPDYASQLTVKPATDSPRKRALLKDLFRPESDNGSAALQSAVLISSPRPPV